MRQGAIRVACVLLLAGCNNSVKVAPPQPGELIGRVEISADVPASSCQVLLEGTPLGAQCDDDGTFDIKNVPPGRWDLRLITDGGATALPAKRIAAASNPGLVSDLGAIQLARPGSVGGHVINTGGMDLSLAVVAVPEVGAVTAPNTNNGYLLDSVAPGAHEVVLITDAGTVVRADVNVLPAKVTIGADLDLMMLTPNMVSVTGHAIRAGQGDGQHAGITVDLVEDLNGTVQGTATTADDGSFSLTARYGTYIVRAHDGSNPITAIVPSVVVRGSSDVTISSALAIQPQDGDLNGNGIPNAMDPDIDGDGFPNEMDAFPYDPSEHLDTDGDGVGDRSDLRSMGGTGIDHKNPTPDTDGDGKLDFEDNCPKNYNPDQWDPDGDGVGTLHDMQNVCDNCPFVPNPDQTDSVGNGIGDACRFCKSNQDCGSGKICQFGQCLDCISSAQCGDEVCDVTKGQCVLCDATHLCPGTGHCNANGHCVQCLATPDCGANMACVSNTCVPQCTSASSCLSGQFCVNGGCVQCRTTADCSGTNYCDNGTCRPQCVTTSDCSGGRICDPSTHTCVQPCNGMCLNGQTCINSVCYTICNQSQPCGAGQVCTTSGYCGPECTTTPDCAAKPFTQCVGGMCVATGMCSTDLDCPASQICSVASSGPPGTCVTRGTALDGNGKYTCASPCDCRLGEICSTTSECVPDPLGTPNHFLSSTLGSGTGDGKTAFTAFNALSLLSSAMPGDVFALHGGDTFAITAPQVIPSANVTVAGGYQLCGTNRWVRDDTKNAKVSNTSTSGKGAFLLTGNSTVPLTKDVFYQLEIDLADNTTTSPFRAIDATWAPQLTLTHLLFKFVPAASGGRILQGVLCQTCNNVAWNDLSTPGIAETTSTNLHFAEIIGGSGTITAVHVGSSSEDQIWAVHLINVSGSSTISGTTVDGAIAPGTDSQNSDLIRVENAPNGTITISGSQLPFTGGYGSGTYRAIYTNAVANAVITNNIVDGSTISSNNCYSTENAIALQDTNGTVSMNTIKFPQLNAGSNQLTGMSVYGPRGAVTMSNNTVSGGVGNYIYLIDVDSITSGPTVLSQNNLSNLGVTTRAYGLYLHNSIYSSANAVIATDNTVNLGGQINGSQPSIDPFAVDGTNAILERNRFIAGPSYIIGNYAQNTSTLELYDNYIANGVASNASDGLEIYNTSTVYAIGNTIDTGGAPTQGTSRGIYCSGMTAGSYFISNLIGGGRALSHFMIYNAGTNCINPAQAASSHNYFWYANGTQQTGESVYALTGGSTSTTPLNNNLVDTNPSNGCYGVSQTQPDYKISTTSVCVNAGATGTRRDSTAITEDVTASPRTLGSAPDIGCFEAM
jgi:hypothetical protein